MIAQKATLSQTSRQQMYGWSVLELDETHHGMGIGYHAQPTQYNNEAISVDGWELMADGLLKDQADAMRDDLRDIEYARTWATVRGNDTVAPGAGGVA